MLGAFNHTLKSSQDLPDKASLTRHKAMNKLQAAPGPFFLGGWDPLETHTHTDAYMCSCPLHPLPQLSQIFIWRATAPRGGRHWESLTWGGHQAGSKEHWERPKFVAPLPVRQSRAGETAWFCSGTGSFFFFNMKYLLGKNTAHFHLAPFKIVSPAQFFWMKECGRSLQEMILGCASLTHMGASLKQQLWTPLSEFLCHQQWPCSLWQLFAFPQTPVKHLRDSITTLRICQAGPHIQNKEALASLLLLRSLDLNDELQVSYFKCEQGEELTYKQCCKAGFNLPLQSLQPVVEQRSVSHPDPHCF